MVSAGSIDTMFIGYDLPELKLNKYKFNFSVANFVCVDNMNVFTCKRNNFASLYTDIESCLRHIRISTTKSQIILENEAKYSQFKQKFQISKEKSNELTIFELKFGFQ